MHSEITPGIKMINCTNEIFPLKIHTSNNYHHHQHHHSILSFRTTEMQPCIQRGNQHKTSKWPLHYDSCRGKISYWPAKAYQYRVTKNINPKAICQH